MPLVNHSDGLKEAPLIINVGFELNQTIRIVAGKYKITLAQAAT
jgi:hypothetical protein